MVHAEFLRAGQPGQPEERISPVGNHCGHLFLLCVKKNYSSSAAQPEGNRYKRQRADSAGLRGHHAISPRKQTFPGISSRNIRLQRLRAAAGLPLSDCVEALLHESGRIPFLLHLFKRHHRAVGHALTPGRNRQQRTGDILYRILYPDADPAVPPRIISRGHLLQPEALNQYLSRSQSKNKVL